MRYSTASVSLILISVFVFMVVSSRSSVEEVSAELVQEEVSAELVQDGKAVVRWVEINPPPGEDGPCYAYFHRKPAGVYGSSGWSGVWCSTP